MIKFYPFLILFILFGYSCKLIKHENPSINPADASWYGRVGLYPAESKVNLTGSAANGGFQNEGNLTLYASTSKNNFVYLQIEQNGKLLPQKFKISGDTLNKLTISGKGTNINWIYKCSEAHTGPLYIHKVEGNSVKNLKNSWNKKIEFIGNSITCGAAADTSIMPCGNGNYNYHHNGYMSYAVQCGRLLKVQTLLSSISGAGIYRNWNSEGPTVPELYSLLNLRDSTDGIWEPSSYNPDLIVVALGTNDLSRGDGVNPRLPFSQEDFVKEYINFLKKIINWSPGAKIVITDSPMVTGERTVLHVCLNKIKAQIKTDLDKEIHIFTYSPMKAHGCTGHPSVEEHTIMADEIAPFLSKVLNNI